MRRTVTRRVESFSSRFTVYGSRLLALVRRRGALGLAAAAPGGVARVEFLDACGLAAQVAQVVELGAADAAAAYHLDLADDGAVNGEDALDADAEAGLAHGEGLADAVALARDADALERLEALLRLRLLDAHVHAHRVARREVRDVRAPLRAVHTVQAVHGVTSLAGSVQLSAFSFLPLLKTRLTLSASIKLFNLRR